MDFRPEQWIESKTGLIKMRRRKNRNQSTKGWPHSDRSSRVVILTDNDLDGVAAAAIVAHRYDEFHVELSSPSTLCEDLASLVKSSPNETDFFVLDLAVDSTNVDEFIELLVKLRAAKKRLCYVDTHERPPKEWDRLRAACTILSRAQTGAATSIVQQFLGTRKTNRIARWTAYGEYERAKRISKREYRMLKALQTAIPNLEGPNIPLLMKKLIKPSYNPLKDTLVVQTAQQAYKKVHQTLKAVYRRRQILGGYPPVVLFFGHKIPSGAPNAGWASSFIVMEHRIVGLMTRKKPEFPERIWVHGRKYKHLAFNMDLVRDALREVGGDGGGHGSDSYVGGWIPQNCLNQFIIALKQRLPTLDAQLDREPTVNNPYN
ncbi:MAG: hypothetical protein ACE5OZ_04360 [Candidatus Heimdallarchaeota archaeon]